ncbi:MAG TPA: hypothetical protein VJU61_22335 [Polyangiaceae bacterium]|nr:hypothetical protein [Polyangiaceae bacterium]
MKSLRPLVILSVLVGLVVYGAFPERASAPEVLIRHTAPAASRQVPAEVPAEARAEVRAASVMAQRPAPAQPPLVAAVATRSGGPDVDETGHPHPISSRHSAIFSENNLLGALNGALDQGDFLALRRMNAQYRKEYPEDEHALQEGYDVIADCLEERTPQAVQAARRFWQTHRASMLRRQVRRHCLEESDGHDGVVHVAPE